MSDDSGITYILHQEHESDQDEKAFVNLGHNIL